MKFTGRVQSDAQIGRTFGVATANLTFDERPDLESGVYLVDVILSPPVKGEAGGFINPKLNGTNLPYRPDLKEKARTLRNNMTPPEKKLWFEFLSNKQCEGFRFIRQKPIDKYIVDFYCPELLLVIELDGDSHADTKKYDTKRDATLKEKFGIQTLRFANSYVTTNLDGLCTDILSKIDERKDFINHKIPLPPLKRGQTLEGLLHFGERKTFGSGFSAEVHILDFDQDIYEQELTIETCKRLRDVIEFPNSDALFTQIEKDIVQAHKFFTRRAIKKQWDTVSSEQQTVMAEQAVKQVAELPEFMSSEVIYAYAPDDQEIPFIAPLMAKFPDKTWCFPKVRTPLEKGGQGGLMNFYVVSNFNDLQAGAFGILEPQTAQNAPTPECILVPAVAGTLEGHRLGRGGGFYDRFLSSSPFSRGTQGGYTVSILPSFAIKTSLELEKHDQRLDKIIEI